MSLALASAANIGLGFVIQFYVLLHFGASVVTDSHVASQTLTILAASLVTGTLPQVLVPILASQSQQETAAWSILAPVGVILLIVVLALHVTAPTWVPLLFGALGEQGAALCVELTRIQLWAIVASGVAAVPLALLRARRRILHGELALLAASVVCAALMPLLAFRLGILGASIALLIRPFVYLLVLFPEMGMPRLARDARTVYRVFWRRFAPIFTAAPIYKLGPVVDRLIGAAAPDGQLTLLAYGNQIWGSGLRVTDSALANPLLADMANASGDVKESDTLSQYRRSVRIAFTIGTVCVIGFWALGDDLLSLAASYTRIDAESAHELWRVSVLLAAVMITGTIGQLSAAAMYALGRTRAISRIALVGFAAATALKIALFQKWGIMGIAAGTVCYYLINHIGLHWQLVRGSQ